MDWIDLAQGSDRWRALVNVLMNLRVRTGQLLKIGLCSMEYGLGYILDLVVKLPKHVILEVTDVYPAVFTYVVSYQRQGLFTCYSLHVSSHRHSSGTWCYQSTSSEGFTHCLVLIALSFFCILKSLYVNNHNNQGEEEKKGGPVTSRHSIELQRAQNYKRTLCHTLLSNLRPKLLVILQKTHILTPRNDSRAGLMGGSVWHNYHFIDTENNLGT